MGRRRNLWSDMIVTVPLGQLITVRANLRDADMWIERRGTPGKVGMPTRTPGPHRWGVRVDRRDVLDPAYLYLLLEHLWRKGHFAHLAHGSTRLVNILMRDVTGIRVQYRDPMRAFAMDWRAYVKNPPRRPRRTRHAPQRPPVHGRPEISCSSCSRRTATIWIVNRLGRLVPVCATCVERLGQPSASPRPA